MNWYYAQIIKESAMGDNSVEAFLARIGVPEETISYVTTITSPELKQQVVGYLRKFPQTPSALLMEKLRPQSQQPQQNPNTPQEVQLANRFQNLEFQKWLLVSLRKARNEYQLNKKNQAGGVTGDGYYLPGRGAVNFTLIPNLAQSIFDWYVRGVLPARQAFQAAQTPEEQAIVINEYGVTNANTNLAGLTFDQADEFADDWHKVVSGEGEGLEYYGEKREDVVFGPKWSKPEWTGWTIKQVVTKNNIRTEGGKMGHCVGSYCDDVLKGNTRIFSLRDPANTPYVTMEVDPKSWTFRQIYGDGPKTGNADPSDNLKAMIGEWMKTLKGAAIEGMDDFDYSDLSYGSMDDDLERAIYKGAEGYGLPISLTRWEYEDAYEAVYNKLNNDRGYRNDGGYQTHHVSKVLARAAVDSDIQKLNEGVIDEKEMQKVALGLAHKTPKHHVMKREHFDRMSPENKREYLKEYLPEAAAAVKKETDQALLDKWTGWERYTNPQAVEQKTLEKAYYNMSQAKEFDYSKIRSFDQLDPKNQQRFMSQAIDSYFQIAQIYDKRQENDESFYDHYDDSYLEFPDEPDEGDFSNKREYQKALAEWEDERQKIQDEAADTARQENLPYCLDDAVIEDVEKILMQTPIKPPRWLSKYFAKAKERSHYPTILWTLEGVNRKKKEALKGKTKRRASGWYNICKFSESFLAQKTSDIYAITFDEAKRSDLIEDGNKFKSNGSYTFVDDSKMICRDEDYNMWVEDVSDFDKRYKIKDGKKKQIRSPFKEGFWQRYEPTEEATNRVEEVSEDEVLLKSNDDEWKITLEEYRKNYKKADNEFSPEEAKRKKDFTQRYIEVEEPECIGYHHGQTDMIVRAYDTYVNELVGELSYNVFDNELHISMIQVVPNYRRQGVGTLLMKKMKEEHPGLKIKPGLMTNEGYPFFRALRHRRVV